VYEDTARLLFSFNDSPNSAISANNFDKSYSPFSRIISPGIAQEKKKEEEDAQG